jgi:hypothetical protein
MAKLWDDFHSFRYIRDVYVILLWVGCIHNQFSDGEVVAHSIETAITTCSSAPLCSTENLIADPESSVHIVNSLCVRSIYTITVYYAVFSTIEEADALKSIIGTTNINDPESSFACVDK